ncbi:hypothetical protein BT63DRAFT_420268 [Microthyrium microscopicum]|uniref:Uncharacterized protein n=1 Tax=Microthyrium microscopicum TaxID=703497 RepID=A0A6A6UU79_9PEZI|nr:hypothetical protein BT63DRAFT_420268 [Microthyrium microscopicum]
MTIKPVIGTREARNLNFTRSTTLSTSSLLDKSPAASLAPCTRRLCVASASKWARNIVCSYFASAEAFIAFCESVFFALTILAVWIPLI